MSRAPPSPRGYRDMSNGSNPSLAGNAAPPSIGGSTLGMASPSRPRPRVASPQDESAMSRAERFDDEKRRIVDSCFSKLDPSGQLAESYITHIRIQEDAQYPSSPPPPESTDSNKKPRLIIVAVRSTGRVRMHKARENANGSFSIGKTWNMEELSAIESYSDTAPPAQTEKEAKYREWAGNTGFTVTITKPYYWQAGTAKEKEFFIASVVKIYRKYTRGQAPELRGFDEQQKNAVLGISPSQQQLAPSQNGSRGPSVNPSAHISPSPAPPHPPFSQRRQSRDDSRYGQSPGPPPSISDPLDLRSPSGGSRQPSQSRERFYQNPAGKPFASTEQLGSQNRDGFRQDHRPGTSPGPGGYRSPPTPTTQMPPPPLQVAQREHNSTNPSPSPRDPPPRHIRPQNPIIPSYMQSADGMRDDQQMSKSSTANGTTGAQNFASARQRWQTDPRREPPPIQTPPPIELSPPPSNESKHLQTSTPRDDQPDSAASSTGDLRDYAAVERFMDIQGPSQSVVEPQPEVRDPSSPPTPERSKKRPPIGSVDLRPPPLNQRKLTEGDDFATSTEMAQAMDAGIEVKPLSPTKSRQDGTVPLSAALRPAEENPSRSVASADVRGEERDEVEPEPQPALEEPEEQFRPGLGPMIKKRAAADRFKKAAAAANAFKPRAGGAAEKILKAKAEREANGASPVPDGISGVVPRPVFKQQVSQEDAIAPTLVEDLAVKEPVARETPKVEVFSPTSPGAGFDQEDVPGGMDGTPRGTELRDESPSRLQTPEQQQQQAAERAEKENLEQRAVRQPQVKIKQRSVQQERYLEELGIDRSLLAEKAIDFESMLYDFGWQDAALSTKALTDLEADLRREQARLEAGSWLSSQDNNIRDDGERQVLSLLDRAIQECDEMDGLLTIYNVELNSLNDDVAFIEAQSQGLQVQSANQQHLHAELTSLVDTISLDKRVLEPLRRADLSDPRGVEDAEQSLVKLYQALVTIDPSVRSTAYGRPKSRSGTNEGNELSSIAALRQKRDVYERESNAFSQRLTQCLDRLFTSSMNDARSRVTERVGPNSTIVKLRKDGWVEARRPLWVYSPLVLFTKELNPPAWQSILKLYNARAKQLYQDAFQQNLQSWKKSARKATGEEADILFTAQDKEETSSSGGALSSARKMTVKRSQTLAKTLRNASTGDKQNALSDSRNTGSLMPSEVFSGAVDEMALLISQEQNFIVDIFHATSLENADFVEVVTATPPADRYGTNLAQARPMDPNREMARRVTGNMDEIFGFFTNDITALLDWTVASDPIQGVGVMACLSRHAFYLRESNQEFLVQLWDQLTARLQTLFTKFVDEQVRAIEETKVKTKKRKGVIGFMKIFPHFSAAVENVFAAIGVSDYDNDAQCMAEVREAVDLAYAKINRVMFDSLKVIAKESPTAPSAAPQAAGKSGADDSQDKAMLNAHILVIENMNHYIEEVDEGNKEGVLAEWKGKALMDRSEALDGYVGRVIRRPLGKLLDFLDSIDSVKESHPHNPSAITSRPTYSRKAARHVLAQYDGKEIRRGIDALRKRIEKHFGDGDDEPISRTLVGFVEKECERAYEKTISRVEEMKRELYPNVEGEKNVEIDFSKTDVQAGFRR